MVAGSVCGGCVRVLVAGGMPSRGRSRRWRLRRAAAGWPRHRPGSSGAGDIHAVLTRGVGRLLRSLRRRSASRRPVRFRGGSGRRRSGGQAEGEAAVVAGRGDLERVGRGLPRACLACEVSWWDINQRGTTRGRRWRSAQLGKFSERLGGTGMRPATRVAAGGPPALLTCCGGRARTGRTSGTSTDRLS